MFHASAEFEEEILEFHLEERFTFLEYLPTGPVKTIQKSTSAPELLCFEAATSEMQVSDAQFADEECKESSECVIARRSLATLSTCSSLNFSGDSSNSGLSESGQVLTDFALHDLDLPDQCSGSDPEVPVGKWSLGACLHSQGQCKPCAWFWRPGSCTRGEACQHCHLCPPGALQKRKRRNRELVKVLRQGQVPSCQMDPVDPSTVGSMPLPVVFLAWP